MQRIRVGILKIFKANINTVIDPLLHARIPSYNTHIWGRNEITPTAAPFISIYSAGLWKSAGLKFTVRHIHKIIRSPARRRLIHSI